MAGKPCQCGCGENVKQGNRFVLGHNARFDHPMQGRKHSEETREKLRVSHLGLPSGAKGHRHSEETRKKMSESHKGVPLSEKHRISLGEVSRRAWASYNEKARTERGRKVGMAQRGKIIPPEVIAKMVKAKKGKRCSPGTEFNSKIMKERYRDPIYVEKMKKAWNLKPNKAEIRLLELLENLYPGEWKYTGDFSFTINGKCPDFVNCNGQKKIIEYFGDHWHQGETSEERESAFSPFGYKTLVIWGSEMKNIKNVINRIHSFVEA